MLKYGHSSSAVSGKPFEPVSSRLIETNAEGSNDITSTPTESWRIIIHRQID